MPIAAEAVDMYRTAVLSVACVTLLAASSASSQDAAPASANLAEVGRLIMQGTNAFRAHQGAGATKPNDRLQQAAQEFAKYMARTTRYSHEADGRQPWERAAAHGYAYCMVSENIAFQFHSRGFQTEDLAERFMKGWEESPGHRRNMLDPDATEIGVGVARSESGRYYAVQLFGRPQSMRMAFRIANRTMYTVSYQLGDQRFQLPPRMIRTHEQCRPHALTVRLPGASQTTTVQPEHGGSYAVEGSKGQLRVSKR
jgi:uncharacterized protein YkwD